MLKGRSIQNHAENVFRLFFFFWIYNWVLITTMFIASLNILMCNIHYQKGKGSDLI